MKNSFLNKKGFSLSENIIVISILGLIIAAVVPGIIHKRELRNDRIAVRKAVTLYQGIMEKGLIEHTGFRTANANGNEIVLLRNEIFGNNCENVNSIFDIVPGSLTTHGNPAVCYFTTKDGIQWRIDNFYTIIRLKSNLENLNNDTRARFENYATDANNLKVFAITARIVDGRIIMLNDYVLGRINAIEKTRNFIMND